MNKAVLDSSAVLALLRQEPGGENVDLDGAVMSTVNESEVLLKLLDDGASLAQAKTRLERLSLAIFDFCEADAAETAMLRKPTKEAGLSLGDRACLALARRLALPVLTGDRDWLRVSVGVDVRMIR